MMQQQKQAFFIVITLIAIALLCLGNFYAFHYLHDNNDFHLSSSTIRDHLNQWKNQKSHHHDGHRRRTTSSSSSSSSTAVGKATIAYVISLTGCGDTVHFDGAAVLKHSIHLNSISNPKSGSKYSYKMYAIVHPDAEPCFVSKGDNNEAAGLDSYGYEILHRDTPVKSNEIEGSKYLREHINTSGCCGEKEMIKLHAYTLTEHPIVVHLDLDYLLLKPLDDLFDVMLGDGPDSIGARSRIPTMFHRSLPNGPIHAFFTRDYGMVNPGTKHVGAQGGFLVIRPSLKVYEEYKTIIRQDEFSADKGWGDISDARYWGDMQFQGIVPYYYDTLHPNTAVELNPCIYNNMGNDPRGNDFNNKASYQKCHTGEEHCEDCRLTPLTNIYSVHYTLCQKPWDCWKPSERNDLCRQVHHEWFKVRLDLDREDWSVKRDGNKDVEHFLGYCNGYGSSGYIPMPEKKKNKNKKSNKLTTKTMMMMKKKKDDDNDGKTMNKKKVEEVVKELQNNMGRRKKKKTTDSNNNNNNAANAIQRDHRDRAAAQAGLLGKDAIIYSDDDKTGGGGEQRHGVAGLSCLDHGGPDDEEVAREMIYWSDIPSDSKYISPFKKHKLELGVERYLTFEPDHGGWNNIRMAMEVVLTLAVSMGRTLVMPPESHMYLLADKGLDFHDFYHLETIAAENDAFDIISMEEFLKREGLKGNLINKQTGKTEYPPDNKRTNWDNINLQPLWEYLRRVSHLSDWNVRDCVAAFPSNAAAAAGGGGGGGENGGGSSSRNLISMLERIKQDDNGNIPNPDSETIHKKPVPVYASSVDRLRETLAHRRELCIYDEEMQDDVVIHFRAGEDGTRLLTHFYAFLYFEDWRHDLWTKRFIRDHMRYLDEIVCAAARVVHAVRQLAIMNDNNNNKSGGLNNNNNNNNPHGIYDAFHIRRGDFQFKDSRIDADVIYENSKDVMEEGSTVFIATDERDKTFFNPLKEHYNIYFLDDFSELYKGLNKNYYGMLDSLIAARGRYFVGCWWSTFTGYINRMRGYYITKHRLEGYEDGTMKSWYYVPLHFKNVMRGYSPLNGGYWTREWPTAWRGIDNGIEDLALEFMEWDHDNE